jgi:hypothetical protein
MGELLSELTLDIIDYEWIEKQTKASFLKKAIRLIEEDGKINNKIYKKNKIIKINQKNN